MAVYKRSVIDTLFDGANYSLLGFLAIACLYPFLHVLFASFSTIEGLDRSFGVLLGPQGFQTKGYEFAMKYPGIVSGIYNTVFYVAVGTTLNVFLTGLLAYVLASNCFWKPHMMVVLTITMFFNGGLIPNFLLIRALGIYNTRWAVLLPGLIGAWNAVLMRTFFQTIPSSLEESAKIDGAKPLTIFSRVILPLSLPIIAVMILYYGVGHWNSWFTALIYLRNRNLFPLQLYLREILIEQKNLDDAYEGYRAGWVARDVNSEIIRNALIVIATFPVVILYPFLQRYFVKGVMIGALKG